MQYNMTKKRSDHIGKFELHSDFRKTAFGRIENQQSVTKLFVFMIKKYPSLIRLNTTKMDNYFVL